MCCTTTHLLQTSYYRITYHAQNFWKQQISFTLCNNHIYFTLDCCVDVWGSKKTSNQNTTAHLQTFAQPLMPSTHLCVWLLADTLRFVVLCQSLLLLQLLLSYVVLLPRCCLSLSHLCALLVLLNALLDQSCHLALGRVLLPANQEPVGQVIMLWSAAQSEADVYWGTSSIFLDYL